MSQQINLYQPIFRKERRKFSATAMLQAIVLMLLGVGAMYGYTRWQVQQLRTEVMQTDKQLAGLTKKLDDISRQFGERLQSKDIQARIVDIQNQVNEKQRLKETLSGAQFNTQGFSDYFIAFARQHIQGVWLTGLDITGAADVLTIRGRSTNPELVPRYLQRLSTEQRLSGIEFRTFEMSRPAVDPKSSALPYIEFLARTDGQAAAAVPAKASP